MKTISIKNSDGETVKAIPVSLKDWTNKPSDYKGIVSGIHYMMRLEDGTTVSRPVYISDPDAETLSKTFIRILHEWLTPEQLDEVRQRNRPEQNPSICHTHDFCDPNQAMIDALERHGMEWIFADEEGKESQTDLINKAWDIAKENEFKL